MKLTTRMQTQAIADVMMGLTVDYSPDIFTEPWRSAYAAVKEARGAGQSVKAALVDALSDRDDTQTLIGMILEKEAGMRMGFPSLAMIAPDLPPIRWLWRDWIPRGMITLLGAVPGAGKSYVALDLARRVIQGLPFPDGSPTASTAGCNVIYVDAEVVPQMINERAARWDMNTERLFLMLPRDRLYIDFSAPQDRDHLIEMAYEIGPDLIVVDSLSSISTKGENNIEDVREILGFLNNLALDMQCGMVLIHHLRKRGTMQLDLALGIDDFRGSSHIIAMSRSVLGLSIVQTGPEPDKNGPRKLEVVKTNLARYPDALGCEFVPLHPEGVMLSWGDSPTRYQEPTKAAQCADWIIQVLGECGPTSPGDLVEMGEEVGYSRSTIYRARKEAEGQIYDTDGHRSPNNMWALTGTEDEDGVEE